MIVSNPVVRLGAASAFPCGQTQARRAAPSPYLEVIACLQGCVHLHKYGQAAVVLVLEEVVEAVNAPEQGETTDLLV